MFDIKEILLSTHNNNKNNYDNNITKILKNY